MARVDPDFNDKVYAFIAQIPEGKLVSYGQVAAACGAAWAAWEVGQIAHTGPIELPWQRVVNKQGGMASGYPGGKAGHKAALESEGIKVNQDYITNLSNYLWAPN